ncbi:MAG: hypothetical protein HY077_04070 [Elusimicrobia bacterium]|nr:hypothetical protein [Elusimicrobiota bacterium]
MRLDGSQLNFQVLRAFSLVLIAAGLLGFLLPPSLSLMSGAPPYDLFHIVFGLFGFALAMSGRESWMRAFNVGFGLCDLYQLAASFEHWFPEEYFHWTRADDAAHLVLGIGLVWVGASARRAVNGPGGS